MPRSTCGVWKIYSQSLLLLGLDLSIRGVLVSWRTERLAHFETYLPSVLGPVGQSRHVPGSRVAALDPLVSTVFQLFAHPQDTLTV